MKVNQLLPMDVVVTRGKAYNPVGWIIMWRSLSNYTHCLTVYEKGLVFDPTIGGVRFRELSGYNRNTSVKIMRYIYPIDYAKLKEWCRDKFRSSKGYDYRAWLGFATGIKALTDEDKYYCSEFPYWAFEENGYNICGENTVFFYPSDFVRSPVFATVFDGTIGELLS